MNKRIAGKKILLVDDEAQVREAVSLSLKFPGGDVTQAGNAEEALKLYKPGIFDCVLTDYNMPGMKGDALAKAIKTTSREQRVVMLSGLANHLMEGGRLPWYLDALVPKPFSLDKLIQAIVQD